MDELLTSEATQTAISQTGILLHVLQFLHIQTHLHRTNHSS